MRKPAFLMTTLALLLAACGRDAPNPGSAPTRAGPQAVAARLATVPTFRHSAVDAAVWVDSADSSRSLLLVSGGEGGLEINDLSGASLARIESLEAGFLDVRQNVAADSGPIDLVITSVLGLGAVQVYKLDAPSRKLTLISKAPLEVHDAVTGLCTYQSGLTGKLYAFIATDEGQLEQWEVFFIKRIGVRPSWSPSGDCFFRKRNTQIFCRYAGAIPASTQILACVPRNPGKKKNITIMKYISAHASVNQVAKNCLSFTSG